MTPGPTVNASGGLPSGTTLTDLRERAELYGGNVAHIDAPDLLCLLDTIDELREGLDEIREAALEAYLWGGE